MKFSTMCLLIAGLAQSTLCISAPTVQLNIKDLPQYSITLVPSTSPEFNSDVLAILAGNVDNAVDTLKPFAVVLKNNSADTIVGFSVRWLLTDQSGRSTTEDVFYHNLNTPSVSRYRLPPGSSAFVSRGFAFVQYVKPFVVTPTTARNVERMASSVGVTISLDGVIFSDGRFVGPDESRAYAQALAATQAETSLLKELIARHNAGQADVDIMHWLTSIATVMLPGGGLENMNWQMAQQRNLAKVLLMMNSKSGAARVYAVATKRIQTPDLAIVKVENGN